MRRLLASVSVIAVLACASAPAHAVMAVVDAKANASLLKSLANEMKVISYWGSQIAQMTNLVSLATVAGEALGGTIDPALGDLFTSTTQAYSSTARAYGAINAIPDNVRNELALFEEPSGGWESLGVNGLMSRLERIRRLTQGTNAAAVANSADAIERRMQREILERRAAQLSGTAVSDLGAAQATNEHLRVLAKGLAEIERANNDMLQIVAAKFTQEETEREMRTAMRRADSDKLQAMIDSGPQEMQSNPFQWGQ